MFENLNSAASQKQFPISAFFAIFIFGQFQYHYGNINWLAVVTLCLGMHGVTQYIYIYMRPVKVSVKFVTCSWNNIICLIYWWCLISKGVGFSVTSVSLDACQSFDTIHHNNNNYGIGNLCAAPLDWAVKMLSDIKPVCGREKVGDHCWNTLGINFPRHQI